MGHCKQLNYILYYLFRHNIKYDVDVDKNNVLPASSMLAVSRSGDINNASWLMMAGLLILNIRFWSLS